MHSKGSENICDMNGWNSPFFITLADIDRCTRKSKSKDPAFQCIKDRALVSEASISSAINWATNICSELHRLLWDYIKQNITQGPTEKNKISYWHYYLIQYICINNRESVKEITWCYETINVDLKIAQDQTKIHGGMWKFMRLCYFIIILGSPPSQD